MLHPKASCMVVESDTMESQACGVTDGPFDVLARFEERTWDRQCDRASTVQYSTTHNRRVR